MTKFSELFKLSSAELDLTQQLSNIIQSEIKAHAGVIPFSRYMELALYYPGLGYYANPRLKFGGQGDFITAPLVSSLFAVALCQQIQELINFGVEPQLFEFGAGNGQLAAAILANFGQQLSHYYILELSADLINDQRETISKQVPHLVDKVVWLSGLPANFNGVMLANEVLDAQPCNLVRLNSGSAAGVGVGLAADGSFSYQDYPLAGVAQEVAAELALNYADYANYQTEIHLASPAFIHSIAASLGHGAILLLDYGYAADEYYHPQKTQGTLRGFYRQHLLEEVLLNPGLIDITSSVNWSAVALGGIERGLELIGYTNQAAFLINCGLITELTRLQATLTASEYLQVTNQVNKLISANEMGEVFKVMGFSKGLNQDSWCGFSSGDRSYSL